jgi:hypothetical protein
LFFWGGAPGIPCVEQAHFAEEFAQPPINDSSFTKFLDGKELLFVSLFMGMCTWFVTNGPGMKHLPSTIEGGLFKRGQFRDGAHTAHGNHR